MIELKECCKVPFPEKLFEEYEIRENAVIANVGCSKVLDMMKRFAHMHASPLFFILEIPSRAYDGITESKIIKNTDDYDVYFVDGLSCDQACQYLDAVGHFLLKDGMNLFGIGVHTGGEEIVFGRYNVMTLFTKNADMYRELFSKYGIKETESLVTAWDTFDENNPGECNLYISQQTGKTIYDIPETYKDYGMYLYEQRKEYIEGEEKKITYEELVGKLLLVGITYYTSEEEMIEQKQFYGKVISADQNGVTLKQNDGTTLNFPPDLSSTKRARPGEYKLRSTGEVVESPDFFAMWNLIKGE